MVICAPRLVSQGDRHAGHTESRGSRLSRKGSAGLQCLTLTLVMVERIDTNRPLPLSG